MIKQRVVKTSSTYKVDIDTLDQPEVEMLDENGYKEKALPTPEIRHQRSESRALMGVALAGVMLAGSLIVLGASGGRKSETPLKTSISSVAGQNAATNGK